MESNLLGDDTKQNKGYHIYEHLNGAPDCIGPTLEGGHVCFHFQTSAFEEGLHNVSVIIDEDISQHVCNRIGLHQELVYKANCMIKEASELLATCPSIDWVSVSQGVPLTASETAELVANYSRLHPRSEAVRLVANKTKKKRKSREAEDPDEESHGLEDVLAPYAEQMGRAAQWSRVCVENYIMGEIEANCTVPIERGSEVSGERFLRSEVWISNLTWPRDVMPPDPHVVSWDQVLKRIIIDNRSRVIKESKMPVQKVLPGPRVIDRFEAIRSVFSGLQFINEFVLPVFPHQDNEITTQILGPNFSANFCAENGQLNDMIGPWSKHIKELFLAVTISEAFNFLNVLRWRNSDDNCMPPMCREQLSDDSLYLTEYSASVQADLQSRDQIVTMHTDISPPKIYMHGFDLTRLYSRCPSLRRSVFRLDNRNVAGPNWRTQRPSFAAYWSGPLPESQGQVVVGSGSYAASVFGVCTAVLKPDATSKIPLHKDMLPDAGLIDQRDDCHEDMVTTAPIEMLKNRGNSSMKLFHISVESLRDGTIEIVDFVPVHKIQWQYVRLLTDSLPHMPKVHPASRNLMRRIKEDNFYYRTSGQSAHSFDLIAPDFESGCQFTQHVSGLMEIRGMSTLHGMFHLLLLSVISGSYPHDSLGLNVMLLGEAQGGKSHIVIELIALTVPGTIVEHLVDSERAAANQNEFCQYNSTTVHHEMPVGFVTNRFDKDGAGGAAENMWKAILTEHRLIIRTNHVSSGIRLTMTLTKAAYYSTIIVCNLLSSKYLSPPLGSRFMIERVALADREGHSVSDYSAWGAACNKDNGSSGLKARASHIIQTAQVTAGLLGTLVYLGVLPEPDHTAFALVFRLFQQYIISKNGQSLEARPLQKCREIAIALMYQRVSYDESLQPYAPASGEFTVRDMFDRHQMIAASLVITETEAIQAIVAATSAFKETDVRRLAVSIIHYMSADSKRKDSFSGYFSTRFAINRKNKDDDYEVDENSEIDFNVARFSVGTSNESLTNWCGELCKIMQKLYNCSMSKEQVRDTLDLISDPQGQWKHTSHHVMDLVIPQSVDDVNNSQSLGEWTVLSMRKDAANRGMPVITARSDVDSAGDRWRTDFSSDSSQTVCTTSLYFPYETDSSQTVCTTNCDISHYNTTGYIAISTAFLIGVSRMQLGNIKDVVDAMCTTNTTPRGIIPVVVTDTMTYGTKLPYVHPTYLLHTHPTRECVVQNPTHVAEGNWSTFMGNSKQPSSRLSGELKIPPFVPIDAYCRYMRVENLMSKDPMMTPDVFTLLPSSILVTIVCPGILEYLERTNSDFHALYHQPLHPTREADIKALVVAYLDDNADLVRHCVTIDTVHTHTDTSPRANSKATMQAKCIAHRVYALAMCKGAGRMRDSSINIPNQDEMRVSIAQLEHALENPSSNYDYSDKPSSHANNLSCLPKDVLRARLGRLYKQRHHINQLTCECNSHSATDPIFTSYLAQYRSWIANGKLVHYHRYENFMIWIRAKAVYLQDIQRKREAKWMI